MPANRLVLSLFAVILLSIVLAGCGDDDPPPSSSTTVGVDWILRSPGTYDNIVAVAIAEPSGRYAAVGIDGTILYSPDGTDIYAADLLGITWTGDKFIAVGDSATILTSPDGQTWTRQDTDDLGMESIWLYRVVSNGTITVAVGELGTILTSTDDLNWKAIDTLRTAQGLYGLTWSEDLGKFVAVGGGGSVVTSPDGLSWTLYSAGISYYLYDVIWAAELETFVAVGQHGAIATSENGENWDLVESRPADYFYGLVWSGDLLMIVGQNGWILSSPDAETFTLRDGPSNDLRDVAWSSASSRFVAVGQYETILESVNGTDWDTRLSGIDFDLNGVASTAAMDSVLLAVGTQGKVLRSIDVSDWQLSYAGPRVVYNDVWIGPDVAIIVGNEGTILYSSDLITWDTIDTKPVPLHLYGVAGSSSRFVALGQSGTILTSADGANWTAASSPTDEWLYDAAWSGTEFVAVGNTGTVVRSVDGLTWTTVTLGGTDSLRAVAWVDDRFVAVGLGGSVWYSTSGATWIEGTWDADNKYDLYGVASSGDIMVAVGQNGLRLISYDSGDTWQLSRTAPDINLNDVVFDGERFVSVGTFLYIVTSP